MEATENRNEEVLKEIRKQMLGDQQVADAVYSMSRTVQSQVADTERLLLLEILSVRYQVRLAREFAALAMFGVAICIVMLAAICAKLWIN
jgi:hypothetical protein